MDLLNRIIDFSLRHRFLVVLGAVVFAVAGSLSLRYLDIDAFPDTTPVQVQINTVAPALGPEEVEQRITFPIEQAIGGLPGLEQMRSISKFGLSQVVVTFKDGTDIYFGRQLINERLATVELAEGIERPKMGPVATGLGEVFHYVVRTAGNDVTQARTIHDWVVKPKMRTVKGAAEINSWGGYEKQYQIRINPTLLVKYALTFDEVVRAVEQNNQNVGGGMVHEGTQAVLVQGVGRTSNLEQLKRIVVTAKDGVPIQVGDVADVTIGSEIRRGAVTADGQGEVVLGLGFMLMGENTHEVTSHMKARLNEIKQTLPANATITPVYDRTQLVDQVINTVKSNLFEGGLLVIAVLFAFLGNLRAAAIVALAIPLSMLFAFCGMLRFGISASLLSLGAIDFGMIVDSSVVMVENCVRHLAHSDNRQRKMVDVVREAAVEVRKPTMFGELIIMIVYLPILTLEGIEGKLFRPMALTVIFALMGSLVLSLTLMPVLASLVLPRRLEEREPLLMRAIKAVYVPILHLAMRFKLVVIGLAAGLMLIAFGIVAPNLGSEFVPRLSEGALAISVVRLTGTTVEDSIKYNTQMERVVLAEFPDEVEHVWSRIGCAEIATDPMGIELTDMFITLKPRSQWQKAHTQADLTDLIEKQLRDLPGQRLEFLQPIEMRMNEMVTGVRSDLAVKLYGDDLDVLVAKGKEIEAILNEIPGSADVASEQVTGQPVLQIKLNQAELARYGVPAKVVTDIIESIGSKPVGEVIEGQLRFPLVIRLPEEMRAGVSGIGSITVPTASGERLPLSRLADIRVLEGPSEIAREWGQRRITVSANVRNRDMGSFVAEAEQKMKEKFTLPPGRYFYEFGGQFEHLERAKTRLFIVVPVSLLLIFGLLYITYQNWIDVLRVFTAVPFGWIGGIFALWIRDMPFSISAAIGFIALSGVAVLDAMILVSYIRQLRARGIPLEQAVEDAATTRLRPVLMTTLVASLGFIPMAFSTGMGAEVQRPLATVVIGGVISAMLMSLLVLRVLYLLFDSPSQGGGRQDDFEELQRLSHSEA
ncbi:MAG TPA: CusA/CzcA family heavy metal efflux RND transporter [Pirellulales bacterium]|jgi:cobalt-zinc-cadmium resistance protein CzcA|nr:CusA/CzcA family heavy metal efflux RND transporter [Pirellulales bacterium]